MFDTITAQILMRLHLYTYISSIESSVFIDEQTNQIKNFNVKENDCISMNEFLHLRCPSYLHEQIDLSHAHIRAINATNDNAIQ